MILFVTIFLTLLLFRLTTCRPAHATHARIIERQADLLDEYDYIIVGAGTVGLTVADRISESGECIPACVPYKKGPADPAQLLFLLLSMGT